MHSDVLKMHIYFWGLMLVKRDFSTKKTKTAYKEKVNLPHVETRRTLTGSLLATVREGELSQEGIKRTEGHSLTGQIRPRKKKKEKKENT